jgi:hypothetical protein
MAVATILSHFFYHAIVVMWHLYAMVVGAAFVAICHIAKWTPTVLSSLWAVTIPVLPVAYRLVSSVISCLWMCMSCTYSILYSASGAVMYVSSKLLLAIPIIWPVLRNLWILLSYNWKMTLVVLYVGGLLINLTDDLDKFDERMVRAISHHMALRHQRRHLPAPEEQEQATVDDDAETFVPTGAYDYSKAYQLNFSDSDETNSEE